MTQKKKIKTKIQLGKSRKGYSYHWGKKTQTTATTTQVPIFFYILKPPEEL